MRNSDIGFTSPVNDASSGILSGVALALLINTLTSLKFDVWYIASLSCSTMALLFIWRHLAIVNRVENDINSILLLESEKPETPPGLQRILHWRREKYTKELLLKISILNWLSITLIIAGVVFLLFAIRENQKTEKEVQEKIIQDINNIKQTLIDDRKVMLNTLTAISEQSDGFQNQMPGFIKQLKQDIESDMKRILDTIRSEIKNELQMLMRIADNNHFEQMERLVELRSKLDDIMNDANSINYFNISEEREAESEPSSIRIQSWRLLD